MTAGQLIEELQKHDPALMVCVRGYEEGVDEIGEAIKMYAHENTNPPSWEGAYDCSRVQSDFFHREILWLKK